jgi:hypothetical protein
MKGDVNMHALNNESVMTDLVKDQLSELANELLKKNLIGRTWSIVEFKKACCFNRDRRWVVKYILEPFRDEIEYHNGHGWCIYGKSYQIRAQKACEWIDDNFVRINWEAKLPK